MKTRIWLTALAVGIFGTSSLFAATIDQDTTTKNVFDQDIYNAYLSAGVSTEADIVSDYAQQQVFYMPLLLPDVSAVLTQSGGILPVTDWSGFSKEFIASLVPVERDGITYWPVSVMEDASTSPRRRLILNAKNEIIAEFSVPKDYDPAWWVKEQTPGGVLTATAAETQMEAIFDGSKLVMEYDIIDGDNLTALVWNQSIEAATRSMEQEEGGGGVMMMWEGGSVSNLQFVDISLPDTNGVVSVMLAYPDGFTNRIRIIACSDLFLQDWSSLVVTNPPSTTNTITYVDTTAPSHPVRYYHAYNVDYDGNSNGVPDGDEFFLPPSIMGTINYSGAQGGLIYVVAVTSSNSWSTNYSTVLEQPGNFNIRKIPVTNYWIKAWRDSDGNGVTNLSTEAWAVYPTNVSATGQVANINLTLADPDADADGLPDWWEYVYFFNTNAVAGGDADFDGLNNLGEYLAGTDPNVADTDGDGMSDIAEVANGRNPTVADSYQTLPYTEGFESYSNDVADGQGGWVGTPSTQAVVQAVETRSGTNALEIMGGIQAGMADQFVAATTYTTNTIWVDFWAKLDPRAVTYFTNYPDISAASPYEPAIFSVNRRGEVWAYNGTNSAWLANTNFVITDYCYHRFTVKESYTNKTWDLHIDGIKAFSNLGFRKYLPATWPRLVTNTTVEATNTDLGGTDTNCAGAAILQETGELLVIQSGTTNKIHVYNQDGVYSRTITLNGFEDTEGMCYVDGNTYAVAEELKNEITLVTITSGTTNIAKSSGQNFDVNITNSTDNTGIEGITYDADRAVFYAVKAKSPMRVYKITLAGGVGYAEEMPAVLAAATNNNRMTSISDVFYDRTAEHLYLLSNESTNIIQVTLGGTIISTRKVADPQAPFNPAGITMSPDRNKLFVICKNDEFIRYGFNPLTNDYKTITEYSSFTAMGTRGGSVFIDDLTVGTSQPANLYGSLLSTNIRVSVASDDSEEVQDTGTNNPTGNDLDLGYKNGYGETQIVGTLFRGLGIAPSSAVHMAYIQFTDVVDTNHAMAEACQVKIEAEASTNAYTFTTNLYNISVRSRTSNHVNWFAPGWYENGQSNFRQSTPDISALVHDVVSQTGWISGDRMAFIFTDATDPEIDNSNKNRREAESYDDAPTKAPLLHVEWSPPLQ